jgi:peptide/nickel transport system substrate-binding protein
VQGDHLVLIRNELHWAGRPRWDRIIINTSPSPPARVAGLLANDTTLINDVPPSDVARLRNDPNIRVTAELGSRVHFITMDQARDNSPFITDKSGHPLTTNPLKDVRVRRALSLAIDRAALVERLSAGQGLPAAQMMPASIFGSLPDQSLIATDPAAARTLLEAAGWPNGFAITIHTTADDRSAIAQAVAQMLVRIGVTARVETLPQQIMSTRSFRGELSMGLETFSLSTDEIWTMMRGYMTTSDLVHAVGQSNSGRYSSPAFDALFERARVTLEDAKREAILQRASQQIAQDVAIIPLFYPYLIWATRAPCAYQPTSNGQTLAAFLASC